ncbi:potassium-transporting ATPase subunit KdpC [Erwinia sp. ACCC 02193]|uniref:Potassium-transporting ATPase KdpC subunit n=1 Tax=Erwinia aeris TaxID=3239803 RepID=A0ABV4E370_9GAMM|nr:MULTISPECIES: potassium-transporting ATPase subunit KdpC [unclassified Erwinia]MDN4625888.1 potassium-transporting ATPase subunit KdpC [Erwinia sp. PsM31]MDN8540294.1 potassium-transporting ATPase subunit KdpC [Erwinia sp. BC051422]
MSQLRPALFMMAFLLLLTGGVYPMVTTLLGQWLFPQQAGGSLLLLDGEVRGSRLLGQAFSQAKYFQGRPSATAETPYNPLASGGSNLAPGNPALDKLFADRLAAARAENPDASGRVPVDLLTASASGLDNGISPEAARWQTPRVAKARQLSPETISRLIAAHTRYPLFSFSGQPYVNVPELNLALDALRTK